MRILVLIAIGLLLYIIIGSYLRKKQLSSSELVSEKMVRCKHCGLHVLEQEALQAGSQYYCSQTHLEADTQSK